MNQVDFAKAIGVSQAQVSRYEKGQDKPSPENLRKIAEVLDVHESYLYEYGDFRAVDEKYKYVLRTPDYMNEHEFLYSQNSFPGHFNNNREGSGKYFPLRIKDESMEPLIPKNSVCFVSPVKIEELTDGAIIFINMPEEDRSFIVRRLHINNSDNHVFYHLIPENHRYQVRSFRKEEFTDKYNGNTGIVKGYRLMFVNP